MRIRELLSNIDFNTPIDKLFSYQEADIYIKRDNLINYSYGGNKVRLAYELLKDFELKNRDMLISYGSFSSNLNRVISNMAYDIGVPCHILTALDEKDFSDINNRIITKNEELSKSFLAKRSICKKEFVRQELENIYRIYADKGYRPYYIYGGFSGKGNENILRAAYEKAYMEIMEYSERKGVQFDKIFIAYGTGMSFEGICRGRDRYLQSTSQNIYGISIARKAVKSIYADSHIIDKYICGGYAKYDSSLEDEIYRFNTENDLFLDPIYTGKAFVGMLRCIKEYNMKGNILFIHTGAYPIYEDWKREYENKK